MGNNTDKAFSKAMRIIKETSTNKNENTNKDKESFERLKDISNGLDWLLGRLKGEDAWGRGVEEIFKEEVIENLEATQETIAGISDNENISTEIKEKQIKVIVENFNNEYNKSEYYSFDNGDLVTRHFADIENLLYNKY